MKINYISCFRQKKTIKRKKTQNFVCAKSSWPLNILAFMQMPTCFPALKWLWEHVPVRVGNLQHMYMKYTFDISREIKAVGRERSGSEVECMTRDRGAMGSSLTGVTALCP